MGYYKAGFEVVGIDKDPQPNYPFTFVQANILEIDLSEFDVDVFHASPPCQKYSWSAKRWKKNYPDLVSTIREKLEATGKPFIIENVVGAPLNNPIMLCGRMFGLGVIRHRLFESSLKIKAPKHHPHKWTVRSGKYCTVAGHGGDGKASHNAWKSAMGIDWMTKEELTQAIPPAYTYCIGKQIIERFGGNNG